MAPRTPIDLDNPSWGDWLRGTIKYATAPGAIARGERTAADFNDWWATRTKNDTLPDREKFLDAMRNDPNANNAWAAFEMGARNSMDKGGFFGPAIKSTFMPDPASPEAMRKMDYASGQLQPLPHLLGTGAGTVVSVADAIASGKALGAGLNAAKTGIGWLGGRLGFGAATEAAPRAIPGAVSWLGEKGSSLASALASALPATTKVVTKGAIPAAAVTAGGLGTNAMINFIDGTPAKFDQQRQEKAAAAAAEQKAADSKKTEPRQPDWYDEMSAISGLGRSTLQEMVRRDGGIRLSTLQALNGMKARAPTPQQQAADRVNNLLTSMLVQAQESGDTERAKELAAMVAKFSAQIAANDEMLASEVEKLLSGKE